jgi:adenylate cyclase
MRRAVKGLILGIATGVGGALFGLTPVGTEFEQDFGLTWLFKVRGAIDPPANVAVVAINERTGSQLGLPKLPRDWPRSIHARLVERLVQLGAAVIVFDVDFHRSRSPAHELDLARAISDAGRVVLFERLTGKRQPIVDRHGRHRGSVWAEELVPPIEPLADAAKGLAPFPLPKLEVAVYQFWAFKPSVQDAPTMPAMALQLYTRELYPKWRDVLARAGASGLEALPADLGERARAPEVREVMRGLRRAFKKDSTLGVRVEKVLAASDSGGITPTERHLFEALGSLYQGGDHRYLNFYGPPGTITTIPYHAVIKGADPNVDPADLDLTNRVVFVGFSDLYDPGQPDRFYTVFTRSDGVDLSGVEIAATAFANLATDGTVKPSGTNATATLLFGFGTIVGAAVYLLPAIIGVPLTLTLAALYGVGAQLAFNAADVWLPLAIPLLGQLPLALFAGLLGQYLLERRQKQHVSKAISYYLPEKIVKQLTEHSLDPSALNQVVYGTCLATDMAGFTSLAEKMPPKELAAFLNDYFDSLAEPLRRHHVDATEFRADGIMCAWTYPQADVGIRREATLAALEVVEAVARFNERHAPLRFPSRVGLDAGWIYVGHAGGGGHFVYSIVGDCANTASRIEGLNKHVGTNLLVTGSVADDIDNLLLRPLGGFRFVGKTDALPVMEVLARKSSATEEQVLLCERFAEALETFQAARWTSAGALFEAILRDYPDDGPTRFYLGRCRRYQTEPPPDGLSVIHMDAK